MTSRIWIGGGNNRANNPADWTPTGAPQPGDGLTVGGGDFTMNVNGNDLAGNRVGINGANLTANLTHQAIMSVSFVFGQNTFNLSQQSNLTVINSGHAGATYNLSQDPTLNFQISVGGAVVNVSGHANLFMDMGASSTTVNLAQNANLDSTFHLDGLSPLTVNGGSSTTFNNNGDSILGPLEDVTLNANVGGKGSITMIESTPAFSSVIEFMQAVGGAQSIRSAGHVKIDRPDEFQASITLSQGSGPAADIDLIGLANADSYTFKNDMLSIFAGNKVIDTLRLHDSTANGFVVQQTSGSVNVLVITDPNNPPIGLPVHT